MNTEPRLDALAQRMLESALGMSAQTAYETVAKLTASEQQQLAELAGENLAEQAGHVVKAAAERIAAAEAERDAG